ncbi:MAG: hypothetical protein IJ710_07885 [Prevotella sp.]|nr:hypothetical protein [Prevotella sp.]
MAKRRFLKQTINLICEELFAECVAASLYNDKPSRANAEALISSILKMEKDYVGRISHVEPGMPAKKYFKNLRDSFSAQVSEIVDQINNLE